MPASPEFHSARTRDNQTHWTILSFVLTLAAVALAFPCPAQVPATNAAPGNPQKATNTVSDLLAASTQFLAAGDWDNAVCQASMALQLDPRSAAAYEQRGSIYIQEKLWDRAERDYAAADHICPDIAYKYKLAEIKFLQRSFDDARLRFVKLQSDDRLGDLATYKVFLCDLLGRHEAAAESDLNALDATAQKPSYYYCHVGWDFYHNQRTEANQYLSEAAQLFGNDVSDLYISSLLETESFRPSVASFVTKDGRSFTQSRVYLERDDLRASTPQGWVTLTLDQLPDDLSSFSDDLREEITKRRTNTLGATTPLRLITLTTKAGKCYTDVRWSLEDDGLSILSPDGWITLPFAQLPPDHSAFPQDLQQALQRKLASPQATLTQISLVSFSTKQGKRYDQVKVSLADHGLRALTADGWIIIPFSSLPDDLSDFPADWRQRIQANRGLSTDDDPGIKVVSFKTRNGKQFTEVRAAIEKNGMHLLTSEGWIAVPFDQLPTDLSGFPEGWQKKIASRLAGPQGPAAGN